MAGADIVTVPPQFFRHRWHPKTDEAVKPVLADFKKWNAPAEDPRRRLNAKVPLNNSTHRSAAK